MFFIFIFQAVQNNGSLYLHVYVVKAGDSPDPSNVNLYSEQTTLYRSRRTYDICFSHLKLL